MKITYKMVKPELKLRDMAQVPIVDYRFSTYARRNVKFEVMPVFLCPPTVDLLWEMSCNYQQHAPTWQGMMHVVHSKCEYPGQSKVHFLPMIDMYPGDQTCILSTLTYICSLAERHTISPVITFDQPLFFKASEVIYNAPPDSILKRIVLRLGSFHTLMNALGAIGTLMHGSGLADILETVYGENAVKHMLTGKSVQRAFRGHLLVEKCLYGMVTAKQNFAESVQFCEKQFNSLSAGDNTVDAFVEMDEYKALEEALDLRKNELSAQSRTAKLWLSYMHMVKNARKLVIADRTGSWEMHLAAVADCLPMFAAAGHFNYVKSAYLYLQNMKDLELKDPEVYRKFQEGYHVVRRTDKFWAGLGCDLVIEQTLMRSLKSTGGLTRGSGMTEEQRTLWTMSSPICSEYSMAMEDFDKCAFTTSEQHKELTPARKDRDQIDIRKVREKLEKHNPFSTDPSLRNIVTGVEASEEVNVDNYVEVGRKIIEKMEGQLVFSCSWKRKDRARTIGDASGVKVSNEQKIDPALLFQRLLVVSGTGDISMEEVLDHELSPFPAALFEAKNVPRKPDKAQLAKAIDDYACSLSDEAVTNSVPRTDCYVLDGGSLIHRVQWTKGSTYDAIADNYADFTVRNYGKATVVFDGYLDTPSIKDSAHDRRKTKHHPKVSVTREAVFNGKKDEFLSNGHNKQGLINLISEKLREHGCNVFNTDGDADCQIVGAAIAASETQTTTLIREDTDLLVVLLYHLDPESKTLYFRSDNKSRNQIRVFNINKVKCLLGDKLCSELLFIHAFSGCDSTSRIFGVGKKSFFEKFVKGDTGLASCALDFITPGKTCETVEMSGNRAMALVFGGKASDSLSTLRHSLLKRKVVSAKSFVNPERLPPTASATKFHSLRVYYQTMTWAGHELDPKTWGWNCDGNNLVPIMCDKNPAPDRLLKVVHCSCATCANERCTCRRYGLPCTSVCGPCQEESCENPYNQTFSEEDRQDSDGDEL